MVVFLGVIIRVHQVFSLCLEEEWQKKLLLGLVIQHKVRVWDLHPVAEEAHLQAVFNGYTSLIGERLALLDDSQGSPSYNIAGLASQFRCPRLT